MRRRDFGIAAGTALFVAAGITRADFIWDGGGVGDLWTTNENWAPDGAPPFDLGGDNLVFGSTGGVPQSPDAGANSYSALTGISFTGADAALTLTGSGTLSFLDGAAITNDSAFLQTVAIDLIANGDAFTLDAAAGALLISGGIDLSDTGGVEMTVTGGFDTTLSGTITGAGGSLLIDTTGTVTISGENSYTGGTDIMGGTVVVANNSAFGGFGIELLGDATLQSADDDRVLANNIDVNANTLFFTGANDLALDGIIFGTGALTVDTTGTLELGGSNAFSGGTTLNDGTILLANNSALGSGDLTLTGDGAIASDNDARISFANVDLGANDLSFTGENDLRLFGVISGTGTFTVNADDDETAITLSGANTYDGGTILNQGILVIGNDDALGTGMLTLTGDGALESNSNSREIANDIDLGTSILSLVGDNDLDLTGILSGTGGLTVNLDEAALTLTGVNTYTGDTNVDAGTLLLDGTIMSDVYVNDGGTFSGGGAMGGNLTVLDGGTFNPAVGIGIMAVDGNYDLQSGGTMQVELNADTLLSDLLDVSGTATLAAGSTISANVSGTSFLANGQTFTIIDADGGVTDLGAMIESMSATVSVTLVVDGSFTNGDPMYALEVSRAATAYSDAATGRNNRAIGLSLDSLIATAEATPMGAIASLLGQLDGFEAADYDGAVNQLSPERHNSMASVAIENSSAFARTQTAYLATRRGAVEAWSNWLWSERMQPGSLASAAPSPAVLAAALQEFDDGEDDLFAEDDGTPAPLQQHTGRWGRIYGVFANQDTTANRTGYEADAFGGQFGFDTRVSDDLVLGLAIGYSHTDLDLDGGLGNQSDDTARIGPYVSIDLGDWYVDASATFAYHFLDGDREMPALNLRAENDYDGWEFSGSLGTGYRHELKRNMWLVPSVSVLYTYLDYDGFTETGGGGANLIVERREADSLRSRLGVSVMGTIDMGLKLVPSAYIGWEHEFLEDDGIDAAFAGGGVPFTVDTGDRDEDSVFFGAAVSALFTTDLSMYVRFETEVGDDHDVTSVAGGVSLTF